MTIVAGRTVLVVDDDKDTLNFIADLISSMEKITVYTASCGPEAIKLLEDQIDNVDILLSDVVMPGMSGVELAGSLADKDPKTKVILMSGCLQPSPTFGNAAEYEKGFIRKPFSGKTLTNHIRKALDELEDH